MTPLITAIAIPVLIAWCPPAAPLLIVAALVLAQAERAALVGP